MPYLTFAQYRSRGLLPSLDADELEEREPGWIATQIDDISSEIDARLRKRYSVPFATPPAVVLQWLTRRLDAVCYIRKGVNPLDSTYSEVVRLAEKADEQITEAANATDGLFDLPLIDGGASAIVAPTTRVYSEQSPYAGRDVQARIGRREDRDRGGTYG